MYELCHYKCPVCDWEIQSTECITNCKKCYYKDTRDFGPEVPLVPENEINQYLFTCIGCMFGSIDDEPHKNDTLDFQIYNRLSNEFLFRKAVLVYCILNRIDINGSYARRLLIRAHNKLILILLSLMCFINLIIFVRYYKYL